MKREILCLGCDRRMTAHLARAFGDFLAPVGEHVKRERGKLSRHCHCDSCNRKLQPGGDAVAVSMWADYGGGPYFPWEGEFLAAREEGS